MLDNCKKMSQKIIYERLKEEILGDWIFALLKTVGDVKMAPTFASRFYFLASTIIYDCIRCFHPEWELVDMYKELGNFSNFNKTINRNLWIEMCVHQALYILYTHLNLPTLHIDLVLDEHSTTYPVIYSHDISKDTILLSWIQRTQSYLNLRSNDNSTSARTFQPPEEYPNKNVYISVKDAQNLKDDLPQPDSWCGLDVDYDNQSHRQQYLTPQWGDVINPIIDHQTKIEMINKISDIYYPSEEVHAQEIVDVLNLCEHLTETHKTIAEFWAGGPGTCTPPGFWMFFSYCCAKTWRTNIDKQALLYYKMGSGLFEAGIMAWALKRKHLQERPIQSIRKIRPLQSVKLYNNEIVDNDVWVPYQESTFVTPPFPDFVSGHSTFSSVGSQILTQFFGTNIIPTKMLFDPSIFRILSPLLNDMDEKCNLCQINIFPKSSAIDATPSTGICLSWNTWDEMAQEAGKSRLYGGIHYESSNQGGLALGRRIFNAI